MRVTPKQYAQSLYELTDGKSNAEIIKSISGFVAFLDRNRKLKISGKIIDQYSKIYNDKKGIIEVEIISRKKLDESLSKKVRNYLKEKYKVKEIILNNTEDAGIKGGFILKAGDEIMNSSVSGQLNSLKKVLIS
jgi:F-type H+-transporting ATPase subunit delta